MSADPIPEGQPDKVMSNALLLISEISKALAGGTKHYDPKTGRELTTVREVLVCLKERGEVRLEGVASVKLD